LGPYGLKGELANNIANRTPLTRTTNSEIGHDAPHVYLADRKIVGPEPIEPVLEEHLINPSLALEPFTEKVYENFRKDRSERIIREIGKLVSAEPISERG
jgi:hypothetical protein